MNEVCLGFVALLAVCGLRFVDCAPSFTGTPNSGNPVYQEKGKSATLSWFYNPDGESLREINWSFKGQRVATMFPSGAPNIAGAWTGRVQVSGSATITISNLQEEDSGKYECRVTFQTLDWIQNEAELIIVVAPQITLQTSGPITIDEGNSRTLLCVASGNPKPLITWYRNNVQKQRDPGNSNYTIASANRDDAGTYRCVATVTVPGLSINPADYSVDVTVRFKPQHRVNSMERNQTKLEGQNAEFYCRLEANPTAIAYRWFKGGNQIFDSADYTINTLFDGQRLTVKQVKKSSAGQYSCEGENTLGTGERKSTYLTVNYAPQQVTVTTDRANADVPLGQSITLSCQADGVPSPSYSWKFDGKFNGVTQNTLTLTNAAVNDAGNYTCVATNNLGSEETTRMVNVEYQPTVTTFTTGTPDNAVVQGTTVTLTCSANGYPAPTYTIKKGNTEVISTQGRHVITNVQLSEEANTYSCETQNKVGAGPTKQLQITVQVPPTFSSQLPTSKTTKTENETVSYSCTVEAKPAATIQWILNGQNLTLGTPPYNISVSVAPIVNSKLLRTLAYLTVNRVTWRQNGSFSCLAFNDAGKKSQTTELEVRYRPVVQFPADHPKNLTLAEGATATFRCKTIGNPVTQSHKWQFNGVDIPGESCNGCSETTFQKASVSQADAGWYSCTGTNSLGEGPPARAQLLIKHPPSITFFPQSRYTINETNNVTMVCRANGVPTPKITWKKTGSNKELGYGEQFLIVKTKGSDDGTYTCTATNELGQDSREITLNVQTQPTIVTSTPTTTQIPGAEGEQVDLTCIVNGKPSPSLSWKRQLNGNDLDLNDDKVKSITIEKDTSVLKVTVSAVGEKFYCVAVNLLGRDDQEYTIRERGVPDAPINVQVEAFQVENAKTVNVNVSWTPGYSGGYDQVFTIHYRVKGSGTNFVEQSVGHPDNNMHTVQGLLPQTEYEFTVQASNQAGKGDASTLKQVKTPDSSVPPDRGTVEASRMADDATVILVTWTVTDAAVTTLSLEIQEGGEDLWETVEGASGLSRSTTEFKVTGLKADKSYRFRMDMRRPGEQNPAYVLSETVPAVPVPGERGGEPLQDWMIAVIAGVAGVLLLAIVILALCCFKRRKKGRGADNVNMSQTSSYAVGGPDVARATDNRRSYGMESVEDDPFIVAASMQSVTSTDGKKKKQDTGVNYGYLSQDSVQQPEMLLNPGSRLARNGRMAQSTGELDVNSAYPARGPQRDFNTLPPYHEPPTFEEAMRQSGRKPKTRKSTGDLAGPGQGRHSGRRPRQARPADEPTDSSDGELRYTPQRAAPPPPRVRHVESIDEPGYTALDAQGRLMGPRVLPVGPQINGGPRRGPLDPTVPYALPQKKPKPKKPRPESHEPAIGPPPQYTPEDRSREDPMLHNPGDLDLDDPSTLPPSERPPDLPPPMAMLSSNRAVPNNYHDHSPNTDDGLPEPPAFLRDIVYPPDGGRDPRYDSDNAMPYHPPSPGRQTRPYLNVHGQLVRPSSQDSDGFRRPESLRSSRNALTPEPEMPPNQWQPRGSDSDDRGAPEINYVSYLV